MASSNLEQYTSHKEYLFDSNARRAELVARVLRVAVQGQISPNNAICTCGVTSDIASAVILNEAKSAIDAGVQVSDVVKMYHFENQKEELLDYAHARRQKQFAVYQDTAKLIADLKELVVQLEEAHKGNPHRYELDARTTELEEIMTICSSLGGLFASS